MNVAQFLITLLGGMLGWLICLAIFMAGQRLVRYVQLREIRRRWEREHQGINDAHKVTIGPYPANEWRIDPAAWQRPIPPGQVTFVDVHGVCSHCGDQNFKDGTCLTCVDRKRPEGRGSH